MKRILSIALCGALCAATLAACGGSSSSSTAASAETLTGTAKGFGGDVTATLTVEDGAITACTLTGDDETPRDRRRRPGAAAAAGRGRQRL